jgi:uncharacterized protein (DUF433 family)
VALKVAGSKPVSHPKQSLNPQTGLESSDASSPESVKADHMGASYDGIITLESGKRSGKPTIRGLRITVYDVLSYLAAGMSHQQILDDFPNLTAEDIRACLSYAVHRTPESTE